MNRRQKHSQPSIETLETRQLLSAQTVMVLDYTPDYRSMGSLQETFYNVRLPGGRVPGFFDFDGDQRLTANDVNRAANEITSRVRGHFSNYLSTTSLQIIGGDVNAASNQLLGDRWLRYGLGTKAVNVSVMFFGGRGRTGEHGLAPLAYDGYNVEGFGEVYVRSIAIDLVNRNPRATSAEFAASIASTAAHELGHMMGLRHATSGVANNIMVPGRGRADNRFTNQAVSTDGGPAQNAHNELWYSLRGQPTYYQVSSQGVADEGFGTTEIFAAENHASDITAVEDIAANNQLDSDDHDHDNHLDHDHDFFAEAHDHDFFAEAHEDCLETHAFPVHEVSNPGRHVVAGNVAETAARSLFETNAFFSRPDLFDLFQSAAVV